MDNKLLHTEGELFLREMVMYDEPFNIVTANGYKVAIIPDSPHLKTTEIAVNAERIVTCVNAMQGLSNEEVESLLPILKDLVKTYSGFNGAGNAHKESAIYKAQQLLNKSKQTV